MTSGADGAGSDASGTDRTPGLAATPSEVATRPAIERAYAFHELGDFTTVDRRTIYLIALAVPIGILGALVGAALLGAIGLLTNLFYFGRVSFAFASPADNELGLAAIAVPVVGGIVVGLMARYGSERIRGHGIPEALESILIHKSRIAPRVTVLKPVSAAISIASGGPFGAEGPIIMTGGSLGSVLGQSLHLSAAERKTLLVAGAAAGMAATFNTPFAAILLAVELLLFEWRPRSLLPVGTAAVVATLVRWPILGSAPLFPVALTPTLTPALIGAAALVGVGAGALATGLTFAVYAFEDLYRRLPVHWMWWPAIGGLVIGVGGLADPRVLGVGYPTIGLLVAGGLGLTAALLLLGVKALVWTASLGSGTSGGVLAPLLMMGAALGTGLAAVLPVGSAALWALVALGAILAGTMRVPFTGVVFSLELTHDFSVAVPLLAACLAAETLTVFTLRRSILTEKIARRRVHAAREYAVDPLEIIPVKAVMHSDIVLTAGSLSVGDVARLAPERTSRHVGYRLVDDAGRLEGFVTKSEIATYLTEGGAPERPVREIAAVPRASVGPDVPIRAAAALLAEHDLETLPVVDPDDPDRYVGLFSREDLFDARVLALQDEQDRERVLRITLPTLRISQGPLGASARSTRARKRAADVAPGETGPR